MITIFCLFYDQWFIFLISHATCRFGFPTDEQNGEERKSWEINVVRCPTLQTIFQSVAALTPVFTSLYHSLLHQVLTKILKKYFTQSPSGPFSCVDVFYEFVSIFFSFVCRYMHMIIYTVPPVISGYSTHEQLVVL